MFCPRNTFKLNADGRKTRECSDYQRLAVLILPVLTKPLLGSALMEPVLLRVPPASLDDLEKLAPDERMHGKTITAQEWVLYHEDQFRPGATKDGSARCRHLPIKKYPWFSAFEMTRLRCGLPARIRARLR